MTTATQLLKQCADVFDEMDAMDWTDDSEWQPSSYEITAHAVQNFLDNLDEETKCK